MTLHIPLHKRAANLLLQHGDDLQDKAMHDELKFLNDLAGRRIVWGTKAQNEQIERVEQSILSANLP